MVNILEKKLMEEDYTSLDLAAALLKMCMGDDNEDIIDSYMPARSLDDLDSYGRNGRRRAEDRGSHGRRAAKAPQTGRLLTMCYRRRRAHGKAVYQYR